MKVVIHPGHLEIENVELEQLQLEYLYTAGKSAVSRGQKGFLTRFFA